VELEPMPATAPSSGERSLSEVSTPPAPMRSICSPCAAMLAPRLPQFEDRFATSVHDDEILMVTPPRRFGLATSTLFGRLFFESPARAKFRVTVSP
jgi:hypothetical protein